MTVPTSSLNRVLIYWSLALMEYHLNSHKDPVDSKGNVQVACRIFEKGLEKFGDELDFVLRYLNFLITINDDTSMSLFI